MGYRETNFKFRWTIILCKEFDERIIYAKEFLKNFYNSGCTDRNLKNVDIGHFCSCSAIFVIVVYLFRENPCKATQTSRYSGMCCYNV